MSISPQSLARTRDKRSHKVPARFNDNVYALVEASEAIRTSTRTRPGSMASKREHDEDGDEKEDTIKAMKLQNPAVKKSKTSSHNDSVTLPRPLIEHVGPNSPSTPPPSKTPSPTIPPLATTSTTTTTTNASSTVTITTTTSTTTPANTQHKTPIAQKQTTSVSSNTSINPSKRDISPPQSSNKKKSSKGQSLIAKQQAAAATTTPSTKPVDTDKSVNSRQGLTATISGGLSNFNIHQSNQPIQPPTNGTTPLVVANGTTQSAPAMPAPVQVVASMPLPAAGLTQTTPRYFNNLTTTQQFGTRLMINEPIYLPRSVAPIAPITATLHQIALQARRPPFISKRAEVCLAYQDELKLSLMLSNHAALIKIASNLGVRDRLNLRCVSRTWKSVVDSESVWRRVIIGPQDVNIRWKSLISKYLDRYNTTELIIKELAANQVEGHAKSGSRIQELGVTMRTYAPNIRRLRIRSVTRDQNNLAYQILESMKGQYIGESWQNKGQMLQCKWEVRIAVDPTGIATVDMDKSIMKNRAAQVESRGDDCVELFDLVEDICDNESRIGHTVEVEPI